MKWKETVERNERYDPAPYNEIMRGGAFDGFGLVMTWLKSWDVAVAFGHYMFAVNGL